MIPRYRHRLMAGVLAVGLPITAMLVVIVTASATSSVSQAQDRVLVNLAQRVAGDIDRFTFERRRDLQQYEAALDHRLDPSAGDVLARLQSNSTAFKVVELLDPVGRFVAAVPPTEAFAPGNRDWFREALDGSAGTSPRYHAGDVIRWVVAEPMRDAQNRVVGVLAADVEPRSLDAVIGDSAPPGGRVDVVDNNRDVVAATGTGRFRTPATVVAASLATDSGAVHASGTVAGVAPVRTAGWGVVAIEPRHVAQAPVTNLRSTALRGTAIAFALYLAFAALFARGEEWRLRAIVEQRVVAFPPADQERETPVPV